MNIALFSDTYYPEINGVATSIHLLKSGLEELGHTVYIFTTKSPHCPEEENAYRIFSIPFFLMKDRRASFPIYLKWLRIFKKLKIDIIHTHTEFSLGILGLRIAKKLNIKHVHTYHTIYEDYIHYLKLPKNKYTINFVKNATKYYCNKTSLVVAPTDKTKLLLEEYGVNSPIEVIPTGIELSKFNNIDYEYVKNLKNDFNIKNDDIVLITLGRLSEEKSVDLSINYYKKLCESIDNVKFIIVGDGPHKNYLENLSIELGLQDKIYFTGYVDWDKVQNYYAVANIFVSSSTSETQGLTYLEALASNLYLLVKEDDSLVGVLEDRINGCKFNNCEEFISGYNYLVEKLKDNNFSSNLNNKYSKSEYAKSVENVYKKLLGY